MSAEAAPETKACPMCGETILAVAIKCKHCGANVDRGATRGSKKKVLIVGGGVALAVVLLALVFGRGAIKKAYVRHLIAGRINNCHELCVQAANENAAASSDLQAICGAALKDSLFDLERRTGSWDDPSSDLYYFTKALRTGDAEPALGKDGAPASICWAIGYQADRHSKAMEGRVNSEDVKLLSSRCWDRYLAKYRRRNP
jgi:hypothetical protein